MAKSKRYTPETSLEEMPMFIMKSSMQRSGSTVERYRTPTNPKIANAMTQYVFDHSQQAQVFPESDPKTVVEATQGRDNGYGTINKSGRSASLGALAGSFIGGTPNESGFQAKYFRK